MYSYIGKSVQNDHLEPSIEACCIKNCVKTNHVIKRVIEVSVIVVFMH